MANNDKDEEASKSLLLNPRQMLDAMPRVQENDDSGGPWKEEPVDIKTWLHDRAFMGLTDITLSEIQYEALNAMDDINPETNRWTEFVLEWGKGSGKDFIAMLAELRQTYLLLCLKSPYGFYGMAHDTGIQLMNVAYTKEQATGVFLNQLKGTLKRSRWFSGQFDEQRAVIKFPHGIELWSAAAEGDSVEGRNLFFAVMDEASAFRTGNLVKAMNKEEGIKTDKSADGIYDVLRTSSRSRFPSVGKVVMISYPRYRNDFIQQKRKENTESEKGWTSGPYATWQVNPRVFQTDFAEDYRRNPEKAKAMYECDPPFAEDGYVKRPETFIQCVAKGKAMGLESPWLDDPVSGLPLVGAYRPDFYGIPGRFYAAHVDLALNKDRCGFCVARQGEPVVRRKCNCGRGFAFKEAEACHACGKPRAQWPEEELPTMIIEILRDFKPVKRDESSSGEVDFAEVREEIMWLRDRQHSFWSLTYDGWQSQDSIQIMRNIFGKRQVRKSRWTTDYKEEEIVDVLSVDRNTEAHDTLKEFIYDGRLFVYADGEIDNETLSNDDISPVALAYREWRALRIQNSRKVDHPAGGSKDLIDAAAGTAYFIARMPIIRDRRPSIAGWSENPTSARSRTLS